MSEQQLGWGAYERMVLSKLDELQRDIQELRREAQAEVREIRAEQVRQRVDIAMLKVKSGLWGAAAGLIPFALYVAYALLGR